MRIRYASFREGISSAAHVQRQKSSAAGVRRTDPPVQERHCTAPSLQEEAERRPGLRPIFDADWRTRALRGDAAAVQALADALLEPLYRFCLYRVGRNRHLCEEVVQETLVLALRDLDRYDPQRANNNIFPWIIGLARNEIHRVLHRERATVSLEAVWAKMDRELLSLYARLDAEPFADEVLLREETRELVNATMSQLPPHYREALEAKYIAGKSVRDLAALGRTTEKAVESLLTRARKAFRATFLVLTRSLGTESP
jgi:RNA polymerase sigma-70 factor (ECF subfamily)